MTAVCYQHIRDIARGGLPILRQGSAAKGVGAIHPWLVPALTIPLLIAGQVAVTLYLMMRRIPTWIDNAYRHENRADNLGSLRRVASP